MADKEWEHKRRANPLLDALFDSQQLMKMVARAKTREGLGLQSLNPYYSKQVAVKKNTTTSSYSKESDSRAVAMEEANASYREIMEIHSILDMAYQDLININK